MSQKIEAIESLRGIGALMVLVDHLLCTFYPSMFFAGRKLHFGYEDAIRDSPVHLLYNGVFAVCLFFSLSGYVLSHKYFTTRDAETVRRSAYKRYFRLMVPVFAAVMISFLVGSFGLYHHMEIVAITGSLGWLDTLFQFPHGDIFGAIYSGLFGVFFSMDNRYNGALWTMNTELQGSFLIYGFLLFFGDRWERIFAYIVGFLLFKDGYMISFLAGMALCDLNTTLKYRVPEPICISITIVGLWIAAVPYDVNGLLSLIGLNIGAQYLNLILGSILVLGGVAFSPFLNKLLSNSFMVWMGKLSFSVYVVHMIIIGSYSCITFSLLNQMVSYNVAAMATITSSIILVYLFATYFYRWFDLGGQHLSKVLYETSYNQVSLVVKKTYTAILVWI
ncbi:acyltransferase [Methanosarcina sp. WWM596]|uniref:acyltransferase family protein n=1 Tax=Methanosarcina sp. WWM596 TaxID=1434103 RepID=UPI0012E032F1|nr:acyltransferase [Methanosarcina sp. WWM596]